ncbi:hypothetical protein GCM10027062_21590 [Nocardioides hungaricus]
MTEAVDAVVAAARPGACASDLYQIATEAMHSAGFTRFRHTHVGHGIGVEARDAPVLTARQPWLPAFADGHDLVLEPGMVLNVEVPCGVLGDGGYQHELTFVVGQDDAALLTRRHPYYLAADGSVDEIAVAVPVG